MSRFRVVNVRGIKGATERAKICYVGRQFAGWPAHPLGNPFRPRSYGIGGASQTQQTLWNESELERCLTQYREWLVKRPTLDDDLRQLWEATEQGDKPLGCWCCCATAKDGSAIVCHAQILADMLSERYEDADE